MNEYKCPHCDAPFEIPSQSNTVVCPYCSTTVHVKTHTVIKEHYLMRLQFNLDEAKDKMFSWALKQLGAPKDLAEKGEIEESKLVFYPFWVVEVEAVVDYTGTQKKPKFKSDGRAASGRTESVSETGHIEMERDLIIPAAKNIPKQLAEYVIATKRKEFFSNDGVLDVQGSLEPIVLEREKALELAKVKMGTILKHEIDKEVDKVTQTDIDLQIPAVFLVHIPFWEIKYDYSIRKYRAMVDGASGRIVYLQFPRKMAFRAMTMLGGLVHLVAGGGLGLLLVYLGWLAGDLIFPTVTGIVFGLGMLAFALRFFMTAMSLRAGEEMAG